MRAKCVGGGRLNERGGLGERGGLRERGGLSELDDNPSVCHTRQAVRTLYHKAFHCLEIERCSECCLQTFILHLLYILSDALQMLRAHQS